MEQKEGPVTNQIIDISVHQAVVKLKELKRSGIQAVIHRASLGADFADKKYKERAHEANSTQDLLWGAYHFATGSDAITQADFFIENAKSQGNELLLLALDLEKNPAANGTTVTLAIAEAIVNRIYNEIGLVPLIYGNNNFLGDLIKDIKKGSILFKCPLWVASWRDGRDPTMTKLKTVWPEWKIWQYTDGKAGGNPKGPIHGIYDKDGNLTSCDRDRFNPKGNESLYSWWEKMSTASNIGAKMSN